MKSRIKFLVFLGNLLLCAALSNAEGPPGTCENDGGGGGGSFSASTSDATGARYRKISTLGFPIPDEKPQQQEETDEEPEETYIDAYNHNLTHQVTDIYIPLQGTDLKLTVRRNWSPEIWNLAASLQSTYLENIGDGTLEDIELVERKRPDRPFGAGWSSNVAANIRFEYDSRGNQPSVAYVTDENGTTYRFLITLAIGGTKKFFPMPESRNQQESLATSLEEVDATTFLFKRKFGTSITYKFSDHWANVLKWVRPRDYFNDQNPNPKSFTWARIDQIKDKFDTIIEYEYNAGNESLIPNKINCRGKSIVITSADNRVLSIKDPNGRTFTYQYDSVFLEGVMPGVSDYRDQTYDVLESVTRPDTTQTEYAYGTTHQVEPSQVGKPNPNWHYYVDLASITDPNGNTHGFTYAFDISRNNYSSEEGWKPAGGSPRRVTSVTSPGSLVAQFDNPSSIYIWNKLEAGVGFVLTVFGERKLKVTDAKGGIWNYEFKDPEITRLDDLEELMVSFSDYSSISFMAFFKTMQVSTPEGLTSIAKFDISASAALKSFKDVSSVSETQYEYTDNFPFTLKHPWIPSTLLIELPIQKWGDPNKQINGEGDEKTFTYDATWRVMKSITDEEGRKTLYTINSGNGNRTKEEILVPHASGYTLVQETDFTYGNSAFPGIVTKKTVKKLTGDPAWAQDLVTKYELDPVTGSVLKEKVGATGVERVTEYTYDANNNKTSAKDPNGNITTFVYDNLNRLKEVQYPGSVSKKTFFDARGNKIREDDELGHSTLREYDAMNRVVKEARDMNGNHAIDVGVDLITETTYNALGAKASVKTPNGWTTTMTYDGLNRLTKTTDPYGKETTYEYGTNSGGLQFGRDFQPTKVVDARGFETLTTYDANYRPIEKKVHYVGTGVSKLYATTKWEYDAVGNVIKEYDPLHTVGIPRITQKTYDALNRETSTIWPDLTSTHTYYTSTGLKWKVEDELTNDTQTEYDDVGKPVKVLSPVVDNGLGTNARAETVTTYDAAGNVLTTVNPRGYTWTYTYDARNRKLTEVRPGIGSPTKEWTYDAVGNVTKLEDARGNETTTTYDAANRVVEVKQPSVPVFGGGSIQPTTLTEYDKNGNATKVTDPNGHETENTYDKLNRLVKTTDAEGIEVENEYDEVGNRTAVIDGKDQRTEFEYDGLKRNTKVKDAANKSTTFEYNAVDKTARVDAMGQRTEYAYDLKHRLTTVSYKDPSGNPVNDTVNATRAYVYDATGNLLEVTEPAKSDRADVFYTYDALKRQLTETSSGLTHTYKYDLAGNRISALYGGLSVPLVSAYDEENRLTTLTQGTNITTYTYDKNGNVLVKTLPNGDTATSVYDAANRTTSLTGVSGISAPLYAYAYEYDAAANVKRVSETYGNTALNRVVTNAYDDINRLTQEAVTGSGAETTDFVYDDANNRESMSKGGVTTSYTYNNLNQLTGWSDGTKISSYTYDDNGNRTFQTISSAPAAGLYWDYENRLVAFEKPLAPGNGIYAFYYDYRSRRVERVYALASTKIVFSGGVSVRELSGTTPVVDYVRGSDWGGGVGGILYSLRGGVPSFTHYNRRGDVTAKTDATGAITYQSQYEAFGKRTVETGATLDRQKSNTKDEDIPGYANEGMRFRDLETGSFISRDPAGFVDGPNLYAYVVQNPWTNFDPDGLATKKEHQQIIDKERGKLQNKIKNILQGKNLSEKAKSKALDKANQEHQGKIDFHTNAITRIEESASTINAFADLMNTAAEKTGQPGRFSHVDADTLDDSKREDMAGAYINDALRANGQALTGLSLATGVGELMAIRGAVVAAGGTKIVTRWGKEGLEAGDWVMEGGKSWWNYIKSGKWQPNWLPGKNRPASFASGQSSAVPAASVRPPVAGDVGTQMENAATLKMKEAMGQRVYDP